ncbi:class I SAM-dependent methyltransferase [Algivirga pacifica]|uniref:Methyltransferase domain-containing protein n=1 Tax=Algivirga pacifica TaxID=1162670 RepID=A0ABP9DJI3_9BACT
MRMPHTSTVLKDTNFSFYENMEIERFQCFASLIGLQHGKDIDIIYPYIKEAGHIMEIGSGYGRVLDFLFQKGYKGKVTAVERVPQLIEYLAKKFEAEQVELLDVDIRDYYADLKVDHILWLWSGILELTSEEQHEAVSHCYDFLEEGGSLIIEAPWQSISKTGRLDEDKKSIKFQTEWGTLNAYFTSLEDVQDFAKECGFKDISYTVYKTDADLERVVYFLKK